MLHGCMRFGHRARTLSPCGGRCSPHPASTREFVPVERLDIAGHDRPCVCMRGRFACEVSGIEFGYGGVDVVGVEHLDAVIRWSVSISMMSEHFYPKRLGPLAPPETASTEDEALSPCRNGGRCHCMNPRSATARRSAISLLGRGDAGVHDSATIIGESSVASVSAIASHSRAARHARRLSAPCLRRFLAPGLVG